MTSAGYGPSAVAGFTRRCVCRIKTNKIDASARRLGLAENHHIRRWVLSLWWATVNSKAILIVAGPNGAGKTTFARRFLSLLAPAIPYVNADSIAAGLKSESAPDTDYHAGRVMLAELDRLAADGRNFSFETTLSGRGYLRRIRQWRSDGYHVTLLFRSLPSADVAVERVHLRAAQGGHFVPDGVVRRRYEAGMRNLRELYSSAVDTWTCLDGLQFTPVVIDGSDDLASRFLSIAKRH